MTHYLWWALLNYDGDKCTNLKGVKYGKSIEDSYEGINCPYYLEKGFAGVTTPAFDDEFFDIF